MVKVKRNSDTKKLTKNQHEYVTKTTNYYQNSDSENEKIPLIDINNLPTNYNSISQDNFLLGLKNKDMLAASNSYQSFTTVSEKNNFTLKYKRIQFSSLNYNEEEELIKDVYDNKIKCTIL